MITILLIIIYLIGVVATAVLLYISLEEGYKVTIMDLMIGILCCATSWVGIFISVVVIFSNFVVFTKK